MADTRYTIPLFTLGVILRYYETKCVLPNFLYGLMLFIGASTLYRCHHSRYRLILIASLALVLGSGYANWRFSLTTVSSPSLSIGTKQVRGHIVNLPTTHTKYIRFQFAPEGASEPLLIHAKLTPTTPRFLPGQYWELDLLIPPRPHYHNPGGETFSSSSSTLAYLHSSHLLKASTFVAWIDQLRAHLQQTITHTLGKTPQAAIISALTIGDQSQLSDSQWKRFRESGIVHLISISGLHVTMVAGLVVLISKAIFCRIPVFFNRWPAQQPALLLGLLTAFFYALIAGFTVPTQRTVFMLSTTVWAKLTHKNWSAMQIWLAALLVVLLLDPAAVGMIGFWLSFLCVGALILSSTHRLQLPTGWRLWIKGQWIASLASLPILAVVFQSLPLLSPLANTIAIPLVSLGVTPLALLGLIDPTGYLLIIAQYLLVYQDHFLDYLLKLPHTYHFHAPPTWTILPAGFAVLLLLFPKGFPFRCWAFIGFLPLFLLHRSAIEPGQWQATAIDVGQGLAVLIQTQHHQLLFDTGQKKAARPALMRVMHHYGIKQLDTLILSHNDNDHTGGAPLLMQEIPIRLLLSSLPTTHILHSKARQSLSCLIPRSWKWDGVDFTLLPTSGQDSAKEDNEKSCVLKVSNTQLSMLIPGDIGFKEERKLIEEYEQNLDVDIILAPHHGSKYASSTAFIAVTSPKWVIFSSGRHNPYRHPHVETLARYQHYGAHIFRTDLQGAILINSNKMEPLTGFIQKEE